MFTSLFVTIRRNHSTILAAIVGLVLYTCYAFPQNAWANPTLIVAAIFIACNLPQYAKLSNKIEVWLQEISATLTLGRAGRFGFQLGFNTILFTLFLKGGVIAPAGMHAVGGVLEAAAITTAASQGAQYLGQAAYRQGIGRPDVNTLLALSANVFLAAIALAGYPGARQVFLMCGIVFGAGVFGVGVLSDLRSVWYPRGGIAVFFGTFNPFHVGHLGLVKRVLEERGVEKVVIHPTIVPRLHADALARGEIRMARIENGIQIYERTDRADPGINYFPTGNQFYSPEDRRHMIELAIADAGLADRVEVAFMPEIYQRHGFHGVFREIRRRYPGKPIHGVHGSDFGAMWVRTIMDESGWHYPFAVVRRGKISATAIRAGAEGMTTPSVGMALSEMRGTLPQPLAA